MNRVSRSLQRIVCCFKGHRPFPKHVIPATPINLNGPTLSQITGSISGTYLNSNGQWANPSGKDAALHIHTGPLSSYMSLCARCHGVYWTTTIKGSFFTDSNHIPELKGYLDWQVRQTWEETQRGKNETAEKLYKQYQMTLKLGYNEDNNHA